MVDIATLAMMHGLIALALWRLLFLDELDAEESPEPHRPWLKRPAARVDEETGGA